MWTQIKRKDDGIKTIGDIDPFSYKWKNYDHVEGGRYIFYDHNENIIAFFQGEITGTGIDNTDLILWV